MAVKLYRLKKAGNTVFPVTVTDAVVDQVSLKTLTQILSEIKERLDTLEVQPGILWG